MAHFMRTSFTGPIPNNPEDLPDWLASNCGKTSTFGLDITISYKAISGADKPATIIAQVKDQTSTNVAGNWLVKWYISSVGVRRATIGNEVHTTTNCAHVAQMAAGQFAWEYTTDSATGKSWVHTYVQEADMLPVGGGVSAWSAEYHHALVGRSASR
jgi:hypothetical protein